MQYSKQKEPGHSSEMKGCCIFTPGCSIVDEDQNTRPKKHGKDTHELITGHEVTKDPDPSVQALKVSIGCWIKVCSRRHGEALDIHDQNTSYGHPPKQVKRDYSFSFRAHLSFLDPISGNSDRISRKSYSFLMKAFTTLSPHSDSR